MDLSDSEQLLVYPERVVRRAPRPFRPFARAQTFAHFGDLEYPVLTELFASMHGSSQISVLSSYAHDAEFPCSKMCENFALFRNEQYASRLWS